MEANVPFVDLRPMVDELRPELETAWTRLLDTRQFVGGPVVEDFEAAWARYCHVPHAVGVANGTDALVLALRGLGVGPGDEVVVPTNTFVATPEAVVLVGATPRFADVDDATLLMSADTMAAAMSPRTRAVIVVHLYGQVADMDAIASAMRPGQLLIEDAAQAHGATWRGAPAGSFGAAGCFSFYPGKNLGAFGDGGAIVTSDGELAGRLRVLRDHGRAPGSHYEHIEIGTNSRLDAIQAAVLTVKLAKLDAWNEARRRIVRRYHEALDGEVLRPVVTDPLASNVHHLAVVRAADRDAVRAELSRRGIDTALHYPTPCHLQEPYRRFHDGHLPVAERAAGEIFSLPLFPQMTDDQVERVCDGLRAVAELSVGSRG